MTIALKKNVPGFRDANGVFRPIRSASYVGGGSSRRKATARDRKKYSRAKAGDLGPQKQERALEDVFAREIRLQNEEKAARQREQARIEKQIEREIYGETSGRTSRGKAQSLAQFIRSEGGINTKKKVRKGRTRYGDSLENFTRKGSGSTGLVTTTPGKGKSLDYMHQAAREAGYDVQSMDDLLDALDNEIRSGKKTYSTHGSMTYNPRKTKNPNVAQTILQQLGGNKFTAMTGAKNLGTTGKDLSFRLPANFATGGINYVKITLNGRDIYDVEFGKLRGAKYTAVKIDKNIYADMLRDLFTRRTGLDTSLGTMGRKNPIKVLKHKFYVGQKLATRMITDNDIIVRGTVISRTPKFVTVKVEGERKPKRCGVSVWSDAETIFPDGRYSMATSFNAKDDDQGRVSNPAAKKNPDLLSMFANAAVGIASTLQINEMVKSRKRKAAPKKRGTTKAKANPAGKHYTVKGTKNGKRVQFFTKAATPAAAIREIEKYRGKITNAKASIFTDKMATAWFKARGDKMLIARSGPQSNPTQPKVRAKGDLYVLTIGSGDDLISVYLHDGDKDGFSKRFKTMAAAKAYASRNKVKMVDNPKQNGIIKRAWARSRAANEYRRELRLEAAAERSRARRRKAEAKAKANPAGVIPKGYTVIQERKGGQWIAIRAASGNSVDGTRSNSRSAAITKLRTLTAKRKAEAKAKANPKLTATEIEMIRAIGPDRIGQHAVAKWGEVKINRVAASLRKKGLTTSFGTLNSEGYSVANDLKKKLNPRRSASGKKAVARSAKANPRVIQLPVGFHWKKRKAAGGGDYFEITDPKGLIVGWGTTRTNALRTFKTYGVKAKASIGFSKDRAKQIREGARSIRLPARNPKTATKRANPKSTARRRTFEMFQGRKVTTARPMVVSNHAPANLDQLGDLIELKIAGGPSLKFNGKTAKLCAANGKLWIAGKRFAKPNPSAPANEINPIGEIDHVVYGTRKPHHGDHDYTHYIHKLGEESGRRPILCVDREGYPVIRGGNYKIEARGIVD